MLRYDSRYNAAIQSYKQFVNFVDDTEAPIIGILTQGTTDMQYYDNHTMIAASYIRYIEAAGGRVVAVPYNLNKTEFERIYQNLNGLLIPGGRMKLIFPINSTLNTSDPQYKMSNFAKAAKFFVDRAVEDFSRGKYFPIFGICLGQEAIALALNQDLKKTIIPLNLTNVTYQGHAGEIKKDIRMEYQSRLFKSFTESELKAFQSKSNFHYHHKMGIPYKTFEESEILKKLMVPLTTLTDNSGNEYITSYELYNYPLFGVQFHPEKTSFEWEIKTDRSIDTVSITHKLGVNFVNECRKNNHKIVDPDLVNNLTVYRHVLMGPKHNYSQLFYFSKEQVMEILRFNRSNVPEQLNITQTPLIEGVPGQNISQLPASGQMPESRLAPSQVLLGLEKEIISQVPM